MKKNARHIHQWTTSIIAIWLVIITFKLYVDGGFPSTYGWRLSEVDGDFYLASNARFQAGSWTPEDGALPSVALKLAKEGYASFLFSYTGSQHIDWAEGVLGLRQGEKDKNPGSGIVKVKSSEGRSIELTHYQYGNMLRSSGPSAQLLELWLGDGTAIPELSVRSNGRGDYMGARIQARNDTDSGGVSIDFVDPTRPRLAAIGNLEEGTILAIENSAGPIAITSRVGDTMKERIFISTDGNITIHDPVSVMNAPELPQHIATKQYVDNLCRR